MMIAHHRLGFYLRARIGPAWLKRSLLVDMAVRPGRLLDQHRAHEHELPDAKTLQASQQAPRALNRQLLVKRIVLAGEIIIACQMDDASDLRAMLFTQAPQCMLDGRVGGKIH